jgi:hypothetical protein
MTQKPRHQGFSCDDVTIRQQYHDDTVDETLLLAVSFALPLLFVSLLFPEKHRENVNI